MGRPSRSRYSTEDEFFWKCFYRRFPSSIPFKINICEWGYEKKKRVNTCLSTGSSGFRGCKSRSVSGTVFTFLYTFYILFMAEASWTRPLFLSRERISNVTINNKCSPYTSIEQRKPAAIFHRTLNFRAWNDVDFSFTYLLFAQIGCEKMTTNGHHRSGSRFRDEEK